MNTERLHELFSPDLAAGTLSRRISASNRCKAGSRAGAIHKRTGYVRLCADGVELWAHRVIWELANGPIPEGMDIDHINGDRSDNRLQNLRIATRTLNAHNRRGPASHNKLGFLGVRLKKGGYEAYIRKDGRNCYLGRFKTPEEASEVYKKAKVAFIEELQVRAA